MTAVAEKIVEEALKLSPKERADLIHRLFISLDESAPEPAIEEAWKKEADSRYEAFKRGDVSASPAEEVFERLGVPWKS